MLFVENLVINYHLKYCMEYKPSESYFGYDLLDEGQTLEVEILNET